MSVVCASIKQMPLCFYGTARERLAAATVLVPFHSFNGFHPFHFMTLAASNQNKLAAADNMSRCRYKRRAFH